MYLNLSLVALFCVRDISRCISCEMEVVRSLHKDLYLILPEVNEVLRSA